MTSTELKALAHSTLTGRASGTQVQDTAHETLEIAIIDYIDDHAAGRNAHASATSGTNCDLTWNSVFSNTNYSFTVNGFDASGNPVEITLITKTASKITVKTFVDATIYAIANAY